MGRFPEAEAVEERCVLKLEREGCGDERKRRRKVLMRRRMGRQMGEGRE